MNLSDINTLRSLLQKNGFTFKKSLGQNFLINPDVCPAMADAACDKETGVMEIGPGIGVLTAELSKRAKRVVAIELDERLKKILPVTLADCNNTEIIYGDVLKTDLKSLINEKFSDCSRVAVCANLPYYITSPIVMSLLESKLPIDSITVMVQKEAAERLCATVGTREAGAVSVAVSYYSEPEILFGVDKESFMPPPKVDSAVIQLHIRENPPVTVNDEAKFFRLVKACFAQRRKTLVNTVSNTAGIDKEGIKKALAQLGLSDTVRGEKLTLEELAELSNLI
ncbi:MAG: 16S rRNA (adenine(1518)-N(6)/adenine(1519)-N(6))-dimethyltransferase RsmA [Acutalibacteraceae bacterium]|nr:16S rRNA (adenine(1518)-N(6)/adenine(1519)-N(6))-dimethyltransferase RsmA [Acutalibacteraceae bacterium]